LHDKAYSFSLCLWEKTEQFDFKKTEMLREEFMKFTEKAIEMGFSRQQIRAMLGSFFPEEDLK